MALKRALAGLPGTLHLICSGRQPKGPGRKQQGPHAKDGKSSTPGGTSHYTGPAGGRESQGAYSPHTNLENDPAHKSPCGLVPESGYSLTTPNSFQVGEMLQRCWCYSQTGRFRLQERGLARVQHVRGWRAVPRLPGRAAPPQGL